LAENFLNHFNNFPIFRPATPMPTPYAEIREDFMQLSHKLIRLVSRCYPFTAPDGQAFVRLHHYGGCHIYPVRSRDFRDWLFQASYAELESLPTSRDLHTVLDHLEAAARSDEARQHLSVYRRVGRRGPDRFPDQILLDLSNPRPQFVEIAPTGWKTTADPAVLFQTSRSTHSLPEPVTAAEATRALASLAPGPRPLAPALEILRSCLNLPSRPAWLRCLAWLLSAFRPSGPYPFLILQGPPNSGKSFAARVLRFLIDPCSAPLTPTPSSTRDLVTLARLNWVLAFDHISTLSPLVTDALCRLSSGLGATFREAPGPAHEPLQQYYKRPILLTVTERFQCPDDIAKRALVVTLPPLTSQTRSEESLMALFRQTRPAILGALCTAVSVALSRMPTTSQTAGPCADALAWAMAASPALGSTEEEMQRALDPPPLPHPIVQAVRNLLEQRKRWTGTAAELKELLEPFVSLQTPSAASHHLKNSMLILADYGIELKFRRLHGGTRIIDLREEPGDGDSENDPQSPSPDFDAPPQPTETEEVKAS